MKRRTAISGCVGIDPIVCSIIGRSARIEDGGRVETRQRPVVRLRRTDGTLESRILRSAYLICALTQSVGTDFGRVIGSW